MINVMFLSINGGYAFKAEREEYKKHHSYGRWLVREPFSNRVKYKFTTGQLQNFIRRFKIVVFATNK